MNSGQFQKGHVSWTKLHGHSAETRKKMSEARMGKSPWNKGVPCSEEMKQRIAAKLRGHKIPIDVRKKISKALEGRNVGEENPNFKGGKKKLQSGYILIYSPYHPNATNGYMFRSRLVMEKHLKRFLKPTEVVHHINGIRDDDRFENLILFKNNSEHIKFHHIQESA